MLEVGGKYRLQNDNSINCGFICVKGRKKTAALYVWVWDKTILSCLLIGVYIVRLEV